MTRSLVEDELDPEPEQAQDIDRAVVQRGESFWGFLLKIFHAVANLRIPKPLKQMGHEIYYGPKKEKRKR